MKLSPSQVRRFWQLWPQACRANGWTKENGLSSLDIDAKRKEVLRECGFKSLTEVDRTNGFTKVKNKLEILVGVSLQAAKEDLDTTENDARMQRWVIENEIIPCLALYLEDVTGYVASVIADLTRHYKTDRPERPPTLSDLSAKPTFVRLDGSEGPSQMLQALMILSARLNEKRADAGDSEHEMRMKAHLICNCAGCIRGRTILKMPSPVPLFESNPF